MLQFENLCKRYDERIIFQGMRYSAGAGCVAVSGETNSGKSTLLGILAGTIEPDQGEVWIDGHSAAYRPARGEVRTRVRARRLHGVFAPDWSRVSGACGLE